MSKREISIYFSFLIIIIQIVCANANNIKENTEIISLINKYYFFAEDRDISLNNSSTEAILESLDKYSEYLSPLKADNIKTKDNYFSSKLFNFCYIRFTNFLSDTDDKFKKSMETECSTLILDLSFCDGGDLDSAINIARLLVPKGKICEIKFKNETKTYYSELEKCPFENIIILTSPKTASASEILISALKESDCAFIIGTSTYGKTAVQRTFKLSDGGILKLTVGKYYTRNKNDIEQIGVNPDINLIPAFILLTLFIATIIIKKFIRIKKKIPKD